MKNWNVSKINILSIFLLVAGCTDTNPTVSILRSIDGFNFTNNHVITASMNSVALQAECSAFVGQVQMSFDGGTTWLNPADYQATAKNSCENGKFEITLSDAKAPWSSMTFANGDTVSVKFRAQPRVGDFIYRTVNVKYVPSSPMSHEILAGSQVQTGTGLHLRGRVRAQDQHVASGGGYKIRGRITQ
ncbi:hypothetical protein ACLWBD_14060 [Bdellovibrio sp. HCB117]|uniref:hypothetical protein n=1 Tax=Bdellovibrio sp. HCB117 TaxID=3394359 RepID=UPI0039B3CE8F